MTPRRQRMIFVGTLLGGTTLATVLALTALSDNKLYFYSPSEIHAGKAPAGRALRVGGIVVDGSVQRTPGTTQVRFALTDTGHQITVQHTGILPDLFREGQGIVATGSMTADGILQASQVLAKHDENYMPPEVASAIEAARANGEQLTSPHNYGPGNYGPSNYSPSNQDAGG
ncbi:MAG: cytochrome c maturation protein CcmE [Gammaproteobacteria bacterium]|nr:cytochrome c maturation protein CcmE [Gammaproteobacteria bacterium]